MKICTTCNKNKTLEEFKKSKNGRFGVYSKCKLCESESRKRSEYRKRANLLRKNRYNTEEGKEIVKKQLLRYRSKPDFKKKMKQYWMKTLYGISLEQYNQMLLNQNRCCALCGLDQSLLSKKTLAVDHNHETGAVRALLCHYCNTAIGSFRENISLMKKAIEYLEKHKKSENLNVVNLQREGA